MSRHYSRQDSMRLNRRLMAENIRRIFLTSLACIIILPVYMAVYKHSGTDIARLVSGACIVFEVIYLVAAGFSFYLMRYKDEQLSNIVYRSFWLMFEVTSFIIIFANATDGAGLNLYAVMLAAVMLVPFMSAKDQIYVMSLQALFAVFMLIKFGAGGSAILNVILLNGLLYGLSRLIYGLYCDNFMMKETLLEKSENEFNDDLTGLLNHRGLERRTFDLTRECMREKRRLSLLMIDFDDLQSYNDTYGTERADACIRRISDIIKQVSLRNTDLICRLYGGRFLVCLEGGDDMEAVRLAEKIRTCIEDKRIPQGRHADNKFVTVSIGAASCLPRHEKDYAETYDEAEEAMRAAKEEGKNLTVYEEQVYGAYDMRKMAAN
ncbi:MAG: GGDEF domain-containing protein [Lachnospiraceae bacterium]|nr:GGDEF domain-containing protein [Lachnospiraceae bacterium]